MRDGITIMEAVGSDAGALQAIQIQTWLTNYPNLSLGITREDIKEQTDTWGEARELIIRHQIELPNSETWIAKDGERIVGFIGMLKEISENKIEAIHIHPEYQRQGIGTELLQRAIKLLGNKKITLTVVDYNAVAIHLYQKLGFVKQGEAPEDLTLLPNGKIINRIIMAKN